MRTLELQNLREMLIGAAFLGTGGGGSLERGLKDVERDLKAGRSFRLADPDELSPDTWACTPYYCGSLAPTGKTAFKAKSAPYDGQECILAAQALERQLGVTFGTTVATELGGGNTAAALVVAAQLGLPALDADGAGRSVPDLQHSTYFVAGIPIAPMGLANKYGDEAVVQRVEDDFHAEALVRALAVASGGHVGVADHPGRLADLRKGLVLRSLSFSEKVGHAIEDHSRDAKEAILAATDGYLLFEGVAPSNCKYEDREGFTFGDIEIRGTGKDRGARYHVWFKNENIMAWRNGKVDVTAPDLVCLFDLEKRAPILNPWVKKGQHIAAFGLPAPEIWRTPRGIEGFGPGYFGYKAKFVPIERKHKKGAR
ncbi:MAG TPA: DUF917 domain-containing protein [Thermoplasmata archaeon]|nr:DUF917 domain-containing protein [Thermoplasmata archaeon]